MSGVQPDEIFLLSPLSFQPLPLSVDDLLPVSVVLLLGYNYRIDPKALTKALECTLSFFPHLSARIHLAFEPLKMSLVPSDRKIQLEWVKNSQGSLETLESMEQGFLTEHYAPSAAFNAQNMLQIFDLPLLQLRISWLSSSNASVLGLMVSHIALDGIGMMYFIKHLSAALQGTNLPIVVHDRKLTFPEILPNQCELPLYYRELVDLPLALAKAHSEQKKYQVTIFSITLESLEKIVGKKSLTNARFYFTALLCQALAKIQKKPLTIALWCNVRGLGHVPRNYTGNTGCYIYLPLEENKLEKCYQLLKNTITRQGFAKIQQAYNQLKSIEAEGRIIYWNGSEQDILSVNLVPHLPNALDLGSGSPVYAQILTRNTVGLRIYSSPDGRRFTVEACLLDQLGDKLLQSCVDMGLFVKKWHHI